MSTTTKMDIGEMVENYGPLMVWDDEWGIGIQANGAYLNLLVPDGDGYCHSDCRSFGDLPDGKCITDMPMRWVWDRCEEWLDEIRDHQEGDHE